MAAGRTRSATFAETVGYASETTTKLFFIARHTIEKGAVDTARLTRQHDS